MALKCFSRVLLHSNIENDKSVYIARGLVYKDMGNFKLAQHDFTKSIEIEKKLSEGYYYRGLCKLATKNFKEAIDDFNESKYNILEEPDALKANKKCIQAGIEDALGQAWHCLKNYD